MLDRTEIVSPTIITTEPNELMAEIHNRMPVILQPEYVMPWLSVDETPLPDSLSCLTPYHSKSMKEFPVVRRTCLAVWRLKSSTQADAAEVLAKRKGVAARRRLKEACSKAAT